MLPGCKPVIGHLGNVVRYAKAAKEGQVRHIYHWLVDDVYGSNRPKVVMIQMFHRPQLIITDHKMVRDLYTTKNKLLDKSQVIKAYFHELVGDSLGFGLADHLWKFQRKVLSQAFYKNKLMMMLDIVKF